MPRKPRPDLSDHVRMAARVELMRIAAISTLDDILQHHVPKGSREYRLADKAISCCDDLKSALDDMVCHDRPDGIGDWCTHVYYGTGDVDMSGITLPEYADAVFGQVARRIAEVLSDDSGTKVTVRDCDSLRADYYKGSDVRADGEFDRLLCGLLDWDVVEYRLTPTQIFDFCKDAIASGVPPTYSQIEGAVGGCKVDDTDDYDEVMARTEE